MDTRKMKACKYKEAGRIGTKRRGHTREAVRTPGAVE